MGVTFKENCPDLRNSKVVEVISELEQVGARITVFDPIADSKDTQEMLGVQLATDIKRGFFDAVLIAVSHEEFISQGLAIVKSYGKKDSVIFDLKGAFKNLDNDDGIILL